MADTRSPSPKRLRDEDDGYDDAPPRKRSASRTPPNASPTYRIAERPARSYTREESGHYHSRRYSGSTPRSRSNSRSSSRRRSHSPDTTPPPKPTHLNYAPTLILRGHKKPISIIRFSPDGRLIASGSADCTIKLWNANTGALEHTLEGHLAGISALTWSPDSRILASGSDDKSIRLWDPQKGIAHPTPLLGHHNYVYSLCFSPKGNMLVSGSYDEAVFLWDVRAARVMRSLPAHSDPVSSVDFVRDGTLIVSCSHDGLIRVWDTSTGQCLRTIVHEDNAPVTCVRFSPNGKYILAWTLDSCIRLWNYIDGKGKCVKTYQAHVNKKYSLNGAFGTYGPAAQFAFIASGDEDGNILLWDVSSKNVLQKLDGHEDVVLSVDTHPSERILASAGLDRTIRVWKAGDDGAHASNARAAEQDRPMNGIVAHADILPPNLFPED
ncbi:WD40-repeat-containing domain protein [Ampelomyces quisqualis]|uniref:WD40-repeat-containing domain protein n=1 Tax=Ampelomyces quisqualis TaxID=50730 RepID=A0A6A5QP97_AMPQU|nr:WD40-repeat-containing domain protein [Ampelomyces quisqualis]